MRRKHTAKEFDKSNKWLADPNDSLLTSNWRV